MPDHTITIKVHATSGDIDYIPGLLKAHRGQTVKWRCQQGNFAVSFHDETPFDRLDLHSTNQNGPFFETDAITVRTEAALASYHYTVAIAVIEDIEQQQLRVFLAAGCPEVRVDG